MIRLALSLSIEETINGWGKWIQEFLRDHGRNPILWMAFFGIGLILFFTTYSALQKEK